MCVGDNAAKVGGSVFAYSCAQNDCLCILIFKQLQHVVEWKRTTDICIEHKEPLWSALENCISEVIQSSCRSQCLVLSKVDNLDVWKLLCRVFDEIAENGLVVVSDYADFLDRWDFGNCGETVPDNWVSSYIEEWLSLLDIARQ